jgi:hypothetical protein
MIMSNPFENPEDFVDKHAYFAFVVDGEVTHLHTVDFILEMVVASMSSDPKVILLSKEDAIKVKSGWYFNGNEFVETL